MTDFIDFIADKSQSAYSRFRWLCYGVSGLGARVMDAVRSFDFVPSVEGSVTTDEKRAGSGDENDNSIDVRLT